MKIVLYIVLCVLVITESHAQSENTIHPEGTILRWRIGVTGGLSAN